MRVLLLGNSNDGGEWFEGGRKRHEIVRDRLADSYGEPVEVTAKTVWPNEEMARVVEGWIEKYEPDVIYLTLASYWFQYDSVPLRVRRLLRGLGPGVAKAGFRVAESPRWGHNALFRGLRRALQSTIGGDRHFTPEQVVERASEVIRGTIRREGIVLAIQGADGRTDYARSARGRRANEKRRLQVHRAMQAVCAQHHVTYENSETPLWASTPELAGNRVGDGLHANARWHEYSAGLISLTIEHALEAAGHPPRQEVAPAGTSATGP